MNDLIAVKPGETFFHTWAATAEDPTKLIGYIPVAGAAFGAGKAFGEGNWAGGILGLAGVGLGVAGAVADPLGTLLSSVASFLIDYMPPLPQMLDALAGNPAMVQGIGATWGNIADRLTERAAALKVSLETTMGVWRGAAADAYKARMEMLIAATQGMSAAAAGLAGGFAVASAIVEIVRTITREIIAELVGRLISYCIEIAATLGLATPVVVGQATIAIADTASTCARYSTALTAAIRDGGKMADDLVKILSDLQGMISKIVGGLSDGQGRGSDAWGDI